MKTYLWTIAKLFLFWMLFFAFTRLVFLLCYGYLLVGVPFHEILKCFPSALALDASTVSYLMTLPIIFCCVELFWKHRTMRILHKVVALVELSVCTLVIIGEIGIYKEWLTKLNYKALMYLRNPSEIITTAGTSMVILSIIAFFIVVSFAYFCYCHWVIKPSIQPVKRGGLWAFGSFFVTGGLCFLVMRGGWTAIPISQSSAYYSKTNVLNDAAVNACWNISHNLGFFGDIDPNRFTFMDENLAEEEVKQLLSYSKDSSVSILNRKDVNVVIILLESWSADVVQAISGEKDIAPNFEKLCRNGLLLTQVYSNGHRSQQAICSILSGFPSVPTYDITDNLAKYKNLHSITEALNQNNYHTSFYFGGDLNYGNIRSFLLHCNFDTIVEERTLDNKLPRGKLGIPDQYLFNIHHMALNKTKEPFFSILFTLSSHSPYDQPKNTPTVSIEHAETKYLNSVKYCDYWLGKYFEQIKDEPWYANTLFVLVGDHGHPTHLDNKNSLMFEYQNVPMLFYGEVLKKEFCGTQNNAISSQIDLPKSLLIQLGLNDEAFCWSKDIFNPQSPEFAFFEALAGFGFKRKEGSVVEFKEGNQMRQTYQGDTIFKGPIITQGRAYLQQLYKTYLNY